ncbi:hypothetical protein [Mycoplasma suis]|nr:hypothetical protein [Mycoplasma suis]
MPPPRFTNKLENKEEILLLEFPVEEIKKGNEEAPNTMGANK